MSYNYYKDQLNRIDTKSEYAPTIKVSGSNGISTKYMNLNDESANELVLWLKENFNIEDNDPLLFV